MKRSSWMHHQLAQLPSCTQDAGVTELALVMPVLLTLSLGALDLALAFAEQHNLESAASRSVEMVSIGGLNSDAFDAVATEAATASGLNEDQVEVDTWLECAGVRQDSIDDVCNSGEEIARYLSVSLDTSYSPLFPFALPFVEQNRDGTLPVSASASVRLQ